MKDPANKSDAQGDSLRVLVDLCRELAALTESRQQVEALRVVAERAAVETAAFSSIRSFDASAQELILVARAGTPENAPLERIPVAEGPEGEAFRQRRVVTPRSKSVDARSFVVAPIVVGKVYYGNLSVVHPGIDHFRPADTALVEGLALALATTLNRLEAAGREADLERRRAESEVLGLLGEMSYNFAHRLGNDLGLVRLCVQNIRGALAKAELPEKEEIEEDLSEISRNVENVLRIVQQMRHDLRLPRPQKASSISIATVLDEVRQSLGNPPGVEVRVELEDDLPPVGGTFREWFDILRNLAINGVEAMPQGGRLTLRARRVGNSIEAEVEDSGIGIAESDHDLIFRFLYSTKGSSGFGLWSAKRMAKELGGDIRVASRPGEGSKFTLSLLAAGPEMGSEHGEQS